MANNLSIFAGCGASGAYTAATTLYNAICGISFNSTTENNWKTKAGKTGTLSKLTVSIYSNGVTAASTYRLRKNGANGNQSVSITASSTGRFEDISNTDSISSSDDLNYQCVVGSTGTNLITYQISISLEIPSAPTTTFNKHALVNLTADSTASTTKYTHVSGYGSAATTTESTWQMKIKTAGTFRHLDARVITNGRSTATTVRFRKNTANGNQNLSCTASTTGYFEDTTNSDTVASDDLINLAYTTGTGTGSIAFNVIGSSFESSAGVNLLLGELTGGTTSAGTFAKMIVGYYFGDATGPSNANYKSRIGSHTISNLVVKVISNTSNSTATNTILKNDVSTSLGVSIGSSSTGYFEDTTDTVSVVDDDLLRASLVISGTGALGVHGHQLVSTLVTTTPVTDTNTLKFNVESQVTDTNTLKFHVEAPIVDTNILKFDVSTSVTDTHTLKFDVSTSVTDTHTLKFDVDQQVTDTNTLKFDVDSKVTTLKTHKFDIQALTSVTDTNTLKFDIDEHITTTKTHKYNLIAFVTDTNTLKFNIDEPVTDTNTLKFDVLESVTDTHTLKFNVDSQVTDTNTLKFDVDAHVTTVKTHKYDLEGKVSTTKTHKYHVEGKVTTTKTHKFNILNKVTTTKTHKFNILQKVTTTKTHKYNVIAYVVDTNTLKFNVDSQITDTNTIKFDVLTSITDTHTLKFNVDEQVTDTNTLKFNVDAPITDTNTLKFNIDTQVTDTNTIKFDVLEQVTVTKTHKFNILTKVSTVKTHVFDVDSNFTEITNTNTLKFDVDEKITVIKVHRYLFESLGAGGGPTEVFLPSPRRKPLRRIIDVITSKFSNFVTADIIVNTPTTEFRNVVIADIIKQTPKPKIAKSTGIQKRLIPIPLPPPPPPTKLSNIITANITVKDTIPIITKANVQLHERPAKYTITTIATTQIKPFKNSGNAVLANVALDPKRVRNVDVLVSSNIQIVNKNNDDHYYYGFIHIAEIIDSEIINKYKVIRDILNSEIMFE